MGLAASQGRYLALTARMSDLIYEGQQIAQQRLALARETEQIADRYSDAMSNTKMVVQTIDGSGFGKADVELTYDILTSTGYETGYKGLEQRLVDTNGYVVVPDSSYFQYKLKSGENTFASYQDFYMSLDNDLQTNDEIVKMGAYFSQTEGKDHLSDISVNDFKKYYSENPNLQAAFAEASIPIDFEQAERYSVDENVKDSKYLQKMILKGDFLIQKKVVDEWQDNLWQGDPTIQEVNDTSDDAAAEAEYEAAMREFNRRDKTLEMRLEQVQTQEQAVEKEIESVKNVIGKNIENSFKTFS